MTRFVTLSAPALALVLVGCGGGPSPKSATKKTIKAPALLADIQAKASPGYQPKDAVVTFAVFTRGGIKGAEARVRKALTASSKLPGPPILPAVSTHAADSLPIRIEALAKGPHAEAIKAATHATFVHSAGPSGANEARLRWAALAAQSLAADAIVVDMTTRVARDKADFDTWISGADFIAEQLKITAYLEGPETLMIHTEGMAKFGLPDVELSGVPVKTAKLALAGFETSVNEIRARGWVGVGDTLKMAKLGKCTRPPITYTHECVRLIQAP